MKKLYFQGARSTCDYSISSEFKIIHFWLDLHKLGPRRINGLKKYIKVCWKFPFCQVGTSYFTPLFVVLHGMKLVNVEILHVSIQTWMNCDASTSHIVDVRWNSSRFKGHSFSSHYLPLKTSYIHQFQKMRVIAVDFSSPSTKCKDKTHVCVCMYVCICIYIYMNICVYIYICIYKHSRKQIQLSKLRKHLFPTFPTTSSPIEDIVAVKKMVEIGFKRKFRAASAPTLQRCLRDLCSYHRIGSPFAIMSSSQQGGSMGWLFGSSAFQDFFHLDLGGNGEIWIGVTWV